MKPSRILSPRAAALLLGGLCSVLYFTSYLTRYSLTVCIAEITGQNLMTKEQIGLATMMLFIFYGAGQLLSGVLGDRIPAQRLVLVGLAGAALSNLLLPLLIPYPAAVAVLWGAHGLCQAMFWPPIVKIVASSLPQKYYNGVTLSVSIAAHVANITLYLLAAFCIGVVGNWRILFYVSLAACVLMAVLWIFGFRYFTRHFKVENEHAYRPVPTEKRSNKPLLGAVAASGTLILLIGIILQGALKEGVTAWLPSFIRDTYGNASSDAILKSVAIPVASIICLVAVSFFYRRFLHNEAVGAAVMFGIGTLMAALIAFVPSMPPMLVIICASLLTGCMHGVNLFLIAYLPARFSGYGKTSTISGVTNSCAYIGCAVYTYGVAWLTTRFGWAATAISWLVIPAVGLVACLVAIPFWRKFTARRLPDAGEKQESKEETELLPKG